MCNSLSLCHNQEQDSQTKDSDYYCNLYAVNEELALIILILIYCIFIYFSCKKFYFLTFNSFVFCLVSRILHRILYFSWKVMFPLCVLLNNHVLINATKSEVSLVLLGIDYTLFTYFISVKHCNIFCIWDQSLGSDLSPVTIVKVIWMIRKDLGSWNIIKCFPMLTKLHLWL